MNEGRQVEAAAVGIVHVAQDGLVIADDGDLELWSVYVSR